MDRLLNLLAQIQETNPGYTTEIRPFYGDGFDFVLKCRKSVSEKEGFIDFDYDGFLALLNDFSGYGVLGIVNDYSDSGAEHVVEFRVRV